MIQDQPSITAQRVAQRRAAHQLLDVPLVFEDPLALRILGPEQAAELRAHPSRSEHNPLAPYLRAFMAVRSRVAEDMLRELVAAGIGQYVVLGAGLDTFAYRNPFAPGVLRVFEVDHPATQAWKRARLTQAGIELPASLTFVPVDFERQSLTQQLAGAGLDMQAGAFFSWLGVVPYLEHAAIRATLAAVAELSRNGGGVVFDYAIPPSSLGFLARAAFELMAARVKAAGEPWRSFFEPAELLREMEALGFTDVQDLSGEQLNERYLAGRADGLHVSSMGHILRALRPAPRKSG